MTTTPHDSLFKSGFGRPDIARSELEHILPAAVRDQLDLGSLVVCPGSFVDEELRQTHSDLLYMVKTRSGRDALVYVLFEHQSSFDALLALRLLRYVLRVWERWVAEHAPAKTVPIVVPVVLHHGSSGWQGPPELASVLDGEPSLIEATRAFVPHFRFVLDDLAALTLDDLAARTVHALGHLALLAFWSSRSHERLTHAAPLMRALAETQQRDASTRALLDQLYRYLLRAAEPEVDVREVRSILLQIAGPQGYEDVMNAAEQLIEQGRAEGAAKGLEALRTLVGTALGARSIPLSELGRARLAACTDIALLSEWVARAVTATSEADVFGA